MGDFNSLHADRDVSRDPDNAVLCGFSLGCMAGEFTVEEVAKAKAAATFKYVDKGEAVCCIAQVAGVQIVGQGETEEEAYQAALAVVITCQRYNSQWIKQYQS